MGHGMDCALLEVNNLSKSYGVVRAVDNVSIAVRQGEIFGLVGENGAGKSTLLKLIAGIEAADDGEILLKGRPIIPRNYREASLLGISMVFQEPAVIDSLRVYENLLLSHEDKFCRFGMLLDQKKMVQWAKEALTDWGLDIDVTRLMAKYSFAITQTLDVIRAMSIPHLLGIEVPLLLFDEPVTGVDRRGLDALYSQIGEHRGEGAMIFVSHVLSHALNLCDRICVLKDGKVVNIVNSEDVTEADLHEMMVGRTREQEYYCQGEQITGNDREVLRVTHLTKRGVFENISFSLREGEILGIGGTEGCGKSELGKALIGDLDFDSGQIAVNGNPVLPRLEKIGQLGIGYIPRERATDGVIQWLPLSWNVTLPSLSLISRYGLPLLDMGWERSITQECVNRMNIKVGSLSTMIASLSGGNQQKVVVGKWLARNAKILVCDDPTRGVDVGVKYEIYRIFRQLVKQGVAVVLITDDLPELIGLSARILIVKQGKIVWERETPRGNKPLEDEVVSSMV